MTRTPLLALTVGDPAGIGPELALHCLADRARLAMPLRLAVIGPARLRPGHVPAVAPEELVDRREGAVWLETEDGGEWERGRPQAGAGRAALAALRLGADLAAQGAVDALVTGPVSKEALHLAGERVEGQTELLGRWAGVRTEMLAVAGELRVLLLTRHLPLRAALDAITTDAVVVGLERLAQGLRGLGIERPRLALAGLNPHAGEGGLLGREEGDVLAPAVTRARAAGLDVEGPVSPDAVFLRASQGAHDGVLALYHDQAFIPVKLAAPGRGLTVLLGLPYLRVSPAHGTAFDLVRAGRAGAADPGNLRVALEQAARWVDG